MGSATSNQAIVLTIRQVRPDEWEVLRAVRLRALEDSPAAFSGTLDEALEEPDDEWRARAEHGAAGDVSCCALAFEDDDPIGMAVGVRDPAVEDCAYLVAMWVDQRHRGTPAAPSLVGSIIGWARSEGIAVLFAGVLEGNDRAAAFYRKLGFALHRGTIPEHPIAAGSHSLLSKAL